MNGPSYLEFLRDDLDRELETLRNELDVEWEALEDLPLAHLPMIGFQHDGAPPHITLPVRSHLNATFPNRWLGRFRSQPWPARSPDLTPLDFFLWGYVKERVFVNACESCCLANTRKPCAVPMCVNASVEATSSRISYDQSDFKLGRRPAILGLSGSRPAPRACVSICRDALLCAVRRSGKIVLKSTATGGRQFAVLCARVI
ncbi:hypothetical protein EVAR_39568_1 [Eumeta japonica]|uniref:Transposable element Tc3 transposase n=1 Tax=Eumeta variegata TaxID=151549 RepID=A0A4C1XNU2_EUMVA|nr:hypothetical protein EVAR_39568_1 [Eumeta japonica]